MGQSAADGIPELPIHDMEARHIGLTRAIASSHSEAAMVCLDRHHVPPAHFKVHKSDQSKEVIVRWTPTDKRTRGAWANENDATRDGAYACVLAAVELLCGLTAIRRSETETGADYYIAEPNAVADDLESYIRLEVSGVDRGNASRVASRLRQKLDQARSGKSDLPAMAGVVGYRARLIRLAPA